MRNIQLKKVVKKKQFGLETVMDQYLEDMIYFLATV